MLAVGLNASDGKRWPAPCILKFHRPWAILSNLLLLSFFFFPFFPSKSSLFGIPGKTAHEFVFGDSEDYAVATLVDFLFPLGDSSPYPDFYSCHLSRVPLLDLPWVSGLYQHGLGIYYVWSRGIPNPPGFSMRSVVNVCALLRLGLVFFWRESSQSCLDLYVRL